MSDGKILGYSFSFAGKNKYYASEVDEYIQSISDSYDSMSKSYKTLEKKLKKYAPAIEEYNANKNIICSAIVRAEKYYDTVEAQAKENSAEIIKSASEEAENYLLTKKAEADAYYFNTTHDAQERLSKLEKDIDTLEKQSIALQEKYINETKLKSAEIIDNAKTKAAEIVAAAYNDAKTAKKQSEEIIASTEKELNRLKAEIAKYKSEIFNVVATIKPTVDSISDGAQFDFVPTEVEVDTDKLADEMPEFQLDIDYDAPAEQPESIDPYEDISSFTNPQESQDKGGIPLSTESFDDEDVAATQKLDMGIFSDDDSEEIPSVFSYQSDYEDLFEQLEE